MIEARELGLSEPMEVRTEAGRHRIVRSMIDLCERENLTGQQKNEIAARLAGILGLDYAHLSAKRILQLMNPQELAEIENGGIDIQLHTHHHRTPEEENSFRREISENRERIRALTGREASHFCYPSGVYRKEFVGWLSKEDVISATTCDAGLVDRRDNPYFLPRFVDTSSRSQLEFESWISGVGSLMAVSRAARQRYLPQE
jgi:hypothetical protein